MACESAGGSLFFATLLLFVAGSFGGCRDNGIPPEPGTAPTFRFMVSAGDRFVYDRWDVDVFGYRIDSTVIRHTWRVLTTSGHLGGFADVIVIMDSAAARPSSPMRRDTLFFRSAADGTLYQYGFLARQVLKWENRVIPRMWDVLISPPSGASGSWVVGPTDSMGTETAVGRINASADYFDVTVNGAQSAFPAYRCDLVGPSVEYYLWMAGSPSCLPRIEEYPANFQGSMGGSVLVLSEMVAAPAP